MTAVFFNTPEIQNLLKNCCNAINESSNQNLFEKNKINLTSQFLNSAMDNPEHWDECTQMNIEYMGERFKSDLAHANSNEIYTSLIFCDCFRFVLERDIVSPGETNGLNSAFKEFALSNDNNFDKQSNDKISFALREIPLSVVKKIVFSEHVKSYKEFSASFEEAKLMKSNWETYLNEKERRIDELNATLTRQESAFNFVGLYAGFSKLGKMKTKELKWARNTMLALGVVMPIPLIIESIYLALKIAPINDLSYLIKVIPIFSITLILVYYFRVALNNYNSVRAQVMQIELRKSLCRFIQSYSDYAKELKSENKDILSKFEDVIFSNIMTSEDKTPSTFDGVEQLAGLISAFKKG